MKCPNCKEEVPEGKRFCGYCGHALAPVRDTFDDDAVTRLDETPFRSEDEFDEGTQTTLADEPKVGTPPSEALKTAEKPITSQPPVSELPAPAQKRGTPGWVWGLVLLVGVIVVIVFYALGAFNPSTRTETITQVVYQEVTRIVEGEDPTSAPMVDNKWEQYEDSLFVGGEDYDEYVIASGTGDFWASFDVTLEAEGEEGSYICPHIASEGWWWSTAWTLLSKGRIAIEGYNSDTDEYVYYPDWKNVAGLNTGLGETNRIEIMAQNNRLAWFINGASVAVFDYPTTDSEHELIWQNCESLQVSVENISVKDLP